MPPTAMFRVSAIGTCDDAVQVLVSQEACEIRPYRIVTAVCGGGGVGGSL